MAEEQSCPRCGQRLPRDARTRGLCPWCLLRTALGGAGASEAHPFAAPAPDELADEFPDIEVLELLGQGGMAAVYKARQRSLDRVTAIKVFPREVTDDPAFAERFRHEARVLAKLNHPHIVAAYEFGQSARYCYFVMEFIDGITLRQALCGEPFSASEAVAIACQICDALAFAHDRGVVHRDIKPENILFEGRPDAPVTGSGRIRVADFGLAKLLRGGKLDFSLTGPAQMLGTLHYMAPEQIETPEQVDHRADIYALGVVLYEMLTGGLPIGRFPEPSALAPVTRRLNALVLRCLAKSSADRFQTAHELRRALDEHLAPAGSPGQPARTRARWRRWLGPAAAGLLALAVVAAGLIPWQELLGTRRERGTGPHALPAGRAASRPDAALAAASLPPEFFLPFPHLRAAPFRSFRQGRARWLQTMVRKYGAGRIAAVWVHNLREDLVPLIHEKVLAASGADSRDSISAPDSVHILIAPVDDLEGAAAKMDFGEVTRVDPDRRVITIEADPAKLPEPLEPEVTDPRLPDFYRRNLEDLGCWDGFRRFAALKRIRLAEPRQLRKEIAAALEKFLRDPHPLPRRLAAEALGSWGAAENVPALIELLPDKDAQVRRQAMTALARLADDRAARAVAGLADGDLPHVAACLRRMGPVAEPAVLDLLKAGQARVRLEAVGVLAEIGTARSVPALQAAARSGEAEIAEAARRALAAIERRHARKPV